MTPTDVLLLDSYFRRNKSVCGLLRLHALDVTVEYEQQCLSTILYIIRSANLAPAESSKLQEPPQQLSTYRLSDHRDDGP